MMRMSTTTTTFSTLLTIILFLPRFSHGTLIPSKLAGQYDIGTYQRVTLIVGTPGRHMNFVVDPESSKLLTKMPLESYSASVKPTVAGNTDIIYIQGRKFRVLIGRDYEGRSELLGCPDCDGVIGVGPGSRIWLHEPVATYTAGAIALGEGIPAFERIRKSNNLGRIPCLPFYNYICAAKARVEGIPNITVIIGSNRHKTLVPVGIFDKYTDGKSIAINKNVYDWGDIDFKFEATPGTGKDNWWKLSNHCILAPSAKKDLDLLLEGGTENVVILSRAAMRCMMVKRFYLEGTAQVVTWDVNKHASTYTLLTIIIFAILFSYWTLDPVGAWSLSFKDERWKALAEALTIILALITLFMPQTWDALWAVPEMWAYAFFTMLMLVSWQFVGAIVYAFQGKDLFGGTRVSQRISREQVQSFIAKYSASPAPSFQIIQDPVVWARQPFTHSVILGVAHPRIWIVQAISRHAVITLTVFLLLIDTRVETFGTLGATGAVILLFYGLVYYGIVGLGMRGGRRHLTFAWVLFWVFYIYLFIASIVILDLYVVKPFMERFTNVSDGFNLFLRVALYSLVSMVAITLAIKRIQLEELIREKIFQSKLT